MGKESACECVPRLSSPLHKANLARGWKRGDSGGNPKTRKSSLRTHVKDKHQERDTERERGGGGRISKVVARRRREGSGEEVLGAELCLWEEGDKICSPSLQSRDLGPQPRKKEDKKSVAAHL